MSKKNRWSGYDSSGAPNVVALKPADVPLRMTFETPGDCPQNVDFSFMQDLPRLASLFARTMWAEGVRYAPRTRRGVICGARIFYTFIKSRRPVIDRASAINYELILRLADWMINVRKLRVQTAAQLLTVVRMILRAAHSLFPDEFESDFDLPVNIFIGAKPPGSDARILSREVFQRLLEAAEKEVNRIRNEYREGDVPEGPSSLIPFMILIAAKTTINPESLYNLRRDCLTRHVIDTNAWNVTWIKRRSKAGMQRQLHHVHPRGNGVIELIQFLLAYTQPLVALAPVWWQDRLLLFRNSSRSKQPHASALIRSDIVTRELGAFGERNNLPPIRMAQLRPTAATDYYVKTGGKLRKVQLLLGHADLDTTERYVGSTVVRALHNKAIRSAQQALVERVTTVIPKEARRALAELAGEIKPEQLKHIKSGEYDTGLCKCRNPFDSPQPGQQKGKCCTLFLACLTCPNALFFLEDLPRVIALRKHFLAEKKGMSGLAWDVLYRDKIKIIEEEIIGAFSKSQIAKAVRLAAKITDLPVLAAKGLLK